MLLNVLVCHVSSWQSIVVSLNRSDYMLDCSDDGSASLKQIEINTFSVAGFGETDRLPEVQGTETDTILDHHMWLSISNFHGSIQCEDTLIYPETGE